MTFVHFYSTWKKEMLEDWNLDAFKYFTYDNFIDAWYAYLKLLDQNSAEGFSCETCGDDPSLIICDGTSIGFRRRMLSSMIGAKPSGVATKRYR